jgi:signal peptidase
MKSDLQKIKKGFQITIIVLFAFLAILFAGAAIPQVGNYQIMTVLSGSMEPAMKTGSVVIVSPAESYNKNDIISFSTGGDIPTTHRIVQKKVKDGELIYITAGDANPTEDTDEVRKEDVLGKVYFGIPYLGYIVEFVRTPLVFTILIGVPALIIIAEELKKIYKEIKKKKEK